VISSPPLQKCQRDCHLYYNCISRTGGLSCRINKNEELVYRMFVIMRREILGIVRSTIPSQATYVQCRTQFRSLNRSRISCTALRVPSPPAHPFARSHFTNRGVNAAVTPIRTGRNSVLCTVNASNSIAYKLSCPPVATIFDISSISSRPGSGGREYTRLYNHIFADAATEETYSAPRRLTPMKATAKSAADTAA